MSGVKLWERQNPVIDWHLDQQPTPSVYNLLITAIKPDAEGENSRSVAKCLKKHHRKHRNINKL